MSADSSKPIEYKMWVFTNISCKALNFRTHKTQKHTLLLHIVSPYSVVLNSRWNNMNFTLMFWHIILSQQCRIHQNVAHIRCFQLCLYLSAFRASFWIEYENHKNNISSFDDFFTVNSRIILRHIYSIQRCAFIQYIQPYFNSVHLH